MVQPMSYYVLEIKENEVWLTIKTNGNHTVADLAALRDEDMWYVSSSTHADSDALSDFKAKDEYLAVPLLLGIGRRLMNEINGR